MRMSANADKAVEMFDRGFNCAQSVLARCCERFGLTRETACHIAQAFGSGMCSLNQTCGAATGALMVIGLKHGKTAADETPKRKAQQLSQEFAKRFTAKHGSLRCAELLGCDLSTPKGVDQARALGLFRKICPKLVRDAAEIVDQLLENEEKAKP
jgi:C_GCAxxG_C_C family probable redox protein